MKSFRGLRQFKPPYEEIETCNFVPKYVVRLKKQPQLSTGNRTQSNSLRNGSATVNTITKKQVVINCAHFEHRKVDEL